MNQENCCDEIKFLNIVKETYEDDYGYDDLIIGEIDGQISLARANWDDWYVYEIIGHVANDGDRLIFERN